MIIFKITKTRRPPPPLPDTCAYLKFLSANTQRILFIIDGRIIVYIVHFVAIQMMYTRLGTKAAERILGAQGEYFDGAQN